jgi:hypothetical protein
LTQARGHEVRLAKHRASRLIRCGPQRRSPRQTVLTAVQSESPQRTARTVSSGAEGRGRPQTRKGQSRGSLERKST